MKTDFYTKAVLTVIAIALALMVANEYIKPAATVKAKVSQFDSVQFSTMATQYVFFDTSTGDIWRYGEDTHGIWHAYHETKITKLGDPPPVR